MSIIHKIKSIFVADRHNPVALQGIETWCVQWNSRTGIWSSDVKPVCQAFTNKADAVEFKESLIEAFKLTQNRSEVKSIRVFKM